MDKDREDRYLMRQRGAGTHKIKDADFGLAFPLPSKLQLAPRLSSASSKSSRTSLLGRPSKLSLGSDGVTPEGTLRRQRSDSAIGDKRESSVVSQRSTTTKRSSIGKGRPVGSSALSQSIRAFDDSTQQETPLSNAPENEAGDGVASEDEEDMPSVAAQTPSIRLVLKRKRGSSPAEDSRISINTRHSDQPGPSMVDELEGPSPGLFMTPEDGRQMTRLENRSSGKLGSRVTSARQREPFRTPVGQMIARPGSSHVVGEIDAHDDELGDEELHDSIQPGDAPQDSSEIVQAEVEEEADELAGEAQVAEEENHEQDTASPTTIPIRQSTQKPEMRRKSTTQSSLPRPQPRTQARSAPSSLRQQAARNIRRSKGAQVLVYRLANTQDGTSSNPNSSVNEEEGEDILSTAPKFIRRPGVNAVDVLNQLCKELIETHLQTLHEQSIDEADPTRRSELRHHRKAIEGFGQELEERCFELTEALDTNHALHIRVRQANREKFTLREELLRLRRERESLALKIDGVKRDMNQKGEEARHENEIHTTMHDIEIAVQRGRARQQQEKHASRPAKEEEAGVRGDVAGLEIQLRQLLSLEDVAAGRRDDHHHPGLLSHIRDLNGYLERALGFLEVTTTSHGDGDGNGEGD